MGINLIVIVENSRHISLEEFKAGLMKDPGLGPEGQALGCPWQGLVTLKLYEEATPELIKRGGKSQKEKGGA